MRLIKLDTHMYKNELRSLPSTMHRIHSKWTTDVDVKANMIKCLKIRVTLCDLGLDNGFLDITLKSEGKKRKIGKSGFIKIKRDIIKKLKRQSMEWEKTPTSYIPDKGLTSRIYKGLLQLNNKDNPI